MIYSFIKQLMFCTLFSLLQPIFIALSNLWTSFQDETVLISVLSNLTSYLEAFLGAHELLFPEKVLRGLLDGVTVKTDVCRMREQMGNRNHPLFPLPFKIPFGIKSLFRFNLFMLYLSDKIVSFLITKVLMVIIENVEN